MNDHKTVEVEKKIASHLITALLNADYSLEVYDGEDTVCKRTIAKKEILKTMFSTGSDYLFVYKVGEKARFGWVRLVYGNGCDVISDYTINLDKVMHKAEDYASKFE